MSFFKRNSREVIYQSKWVNLFRDSVTTKTGTTYPEYHVLDFQHPAVGAVVVNSKNEILMIQARRYIQNQNMWEIPAGGVEDQEELVLAAEREVKEETGYTVELLKQDYFYFSSIGISNQEFHLYFGQLKEHISQTTFDSDEINDVKWFSKAELLNMIRTNEIKDGFTLTALLLYFQS
ncbi:NUDIX hydrolase [Carnobacterium gallinarum]|uniref:NUDIX hydrolase n=1 Tax=Carnobacterium gallinarum TaxID=2749 RepID=UPI0005509F5E|nr:NUDIX hydrolase [Carnobacterium gallinarum]